MPPKLLALYLCWHSAGEAGRRDYHLRAAWSSQHLPLHPLTLLSLLLLSQCCWDKTLLKKPQLCCTQNPPRHCECRACNNEKDTSLPSSQGAHFSKDWKWNSISIKFQLCKISYTDLLYNVVFTVSNTGLYTQKFKRVDLISCIITNNKTHYYIYFIYTSRFDPCFFVDIYICVCVSVYICKKSIYRGLYIFGIIFLIFEYQSNICIRSCFEELSSFSYMFTCCI